MAAIRVATNHPIVQRFLTVSGLNRYEIATDTATSEADQALEQRFGTVAVWIP